jgi:hypothetical protein
MVIMKVLENVKHIIISKLTKLLISINYEIKFFN